MLQNLLDIVNRIVVGSNFIIYNGNNLILLMINHPIIITFSLETIFIKIYLVYSKGLSISLIQIYTNLRSNFFKLTLKSKMARLIMSL